MFTKLSLMLAALVFSIAVLAADEAGFTLRSYTEAGGSGAQ